MYDYTTFKFRFKLPEGEARTVGRALNLVRDHLDWSALHFNRRILTHNQFQAAFPGAGLGTECSHDGAKLALKIARQIKATVPADFNDDGAPRDPKPLVSVLAETGPGGLILSNDVEVTEIRTVVAFAQAVQEAYGLAPFAIRWADIRTDAEDGGGAVWLERGKAPEWNDPAEWLKGKRQAAPDAAAGAGAGAAPRMEP